MVIVIGGLCMMAMQLVNSSVMRKKQIIQQFDFSSTFFQVMETAADFGWLSFEV